MVARVMVAKPKRQLPDLAQKVENSPVLDWWLAHRDGLPERVLELIMSDCAHRIAALHAFEGDPAIANARMGDTIRVALLRADLRCFDREKKHLGPVEDYRRWKKPGDPSVTTIYRRFKTWKRAKAAAGIGLTHTAAATALRSDGTRRTPPGFKWSLDDRVRAVATWREHGCFGGLRLSSEDYVDFQQHRWQGVLPDYQRVTGRVNYTENGKERTRREYSWAEMNRMAEDLALAEPDEFPRFAAFVRQQRGLVMEKEPVAMELVTPVAA